MGLTSRERIMRIFANEPCDRPALKIWGADPGQPLLHPDYGPVAEKAAAVTDLFITASSGFNVYAGQNYDRLADVEDSATPDPEWVDRTTTLHTPLGDLRAIDRVSAIGDPGYTIEHMVKEPEDIRRALSLPYEEFAFDGSLLERENRRIGDRGVVLYGLDDPLHALCRLTGSQNLAIFAYDCRELMHEAVYTYAARIHGHVRQALGARPKLAFAWCGPELCIPPLMAPADFEEFVFDAEKPYCDTIHDAGCYVWVHCHGKVARFIDRFIGMGVDVLNPLEPGKNGDVCLDSVVSRFGSRIGLEGNIEMQALMELDAEALREQIKACVTQGAAGGRFILCPTSSYMEFARPARRYLDNLMTFAEYGLECVEGLRQ